MEGGRDTEKDKERKREMEGGIQTKRENKKLSYYFTVCDELVV